MNYKKLVDFVERTGATFAATFLALATTTNVHGTKELEVAAIAGAVSAGKFAMIELNTYLKT